MFNGLNLPRKERPGPYVSAAAPTDGGGRSDKHQKRLMAWEAYARGGESIASVSMC